MKYILLLIALTICSCEGINESNRQRDIKINRKRSAEIESQTLCKWSTKFNACFCVIHAYKRAGIAFAPADVCDGEENWATHD